MTPSVECRLLLVEAPSLQWGLEAPIVREAVDPRGYEGPPPIDVAAVLGMGSRDEGGRVLIVSTPRGDVALRAVGHLRVVSIRRSEMLEIPSEVQRNSRSETVRAVVLRDGALPILVLSPERVAAAAGGGR